MPLPSFSLTSPLGLIIAVWYLTLVGGSGKYAECIQLMVTVTLKLFARAALSGVSQATALLSFLEASPQCSLACDFLCFTTNNLNFVVLWQNFLLCEFDAVSKSCIEFWLCMGSLLFSISLWSYWDVGRGQECVCSHDSSDTEGGHPSSPSSPFFPLGSTTKGGLLGRSMGFLRCLAHFAKILSVKFCQLVCPHCVRCDHCPRAWATCVLLNSISPACHTGKSLSLLCVFISLFT